MKKLGIKRLEKRVFNYTTVTTHFLAVAENLLYQQFVTTKPNSIWVRDIIYIKAKQHNSYNWSLY